MVQFGVGRSESMSAADFGGGGDLQITRNSLRGVAATDREAVSDQPSARRKRRGLKPSVVPALAAAKRWQKDRREFLGIV